MGLFCSYFPLQQGWRGLGRGLYARSTYSSVSVLILIISPVSTNIGTEITAPVSSSAVYVTLPAELPRTPGGADVTFNSTLIGNSTVIGLPSK